MERNNKQSQAVARECRRLLAMANTESLIRCRIQEQGNGFPKIGDFVDDDGVPYRVVQSTGAIFIGTCGRDNYIFATIEPVEWDDIPDGGDVWPCRVFDERDERGAP